MEKTKYERAGSQLFYWQPASNWLEALPTGNGRLGAMYFAGPVEDKIALNHDQFWSGYPENFRDHEVFEDFDMELDRPAIWKEVQRLTMAGEYVEAEKLMQEHLMGPYTESYLPLGDIHLSFEGLDQLHDYERCLDLEEGLTTMSFMAKDATYRRQLFVSHPDQVMVLEMETDAEEGMSFSVRQESPWTRRTVARLEDGHAVIDLSGLAPSQSFPNYYDGTDKPVVFEDSDDKRGMRSASRVKVISDGIATVSGDEIRIEGAKQARLVWAASTSFNGFDKHPYTEGKDEWAAVDQVFAALPSDLNSLLERHTEDHKALYGRIRFSLGNEDVSTNELPKRLLEHSRGKTDLKLYELLFNYSRYLLIAGSRPGTEALNLQGIWNEEVRPPWSSNYTININTEMNYWPAEVLGLAECAEPMLQMVRELAISGSQVAKDFYGAEGFVVHHNTDIWRHAYPCGYKADGSIVWGAWPLGSAWLATHFRRSHLYRDMEGLKEDYLVLKAASIFYLDQLSETEEGELVFAPSTSPEHWYMRDGVHTIISKSAAMTQGILYDLFTDTLEAGVGSGDDVWLQELKDARDRLEMYKISSAVPGMEGTLQEWHDDCIEGDIYHRHVSHLYGMYPGRTITRKTPEWVEAVRKSMIRRGDEGTGWSLGWKTALWARLGDGDHALKMIDQQLRPVDMGRAYSYSGGGGSYPNLLDAHPPFQIDGNFANGAAVAELFLQAEEDGHSCDLYILPSLPSRWQDVKMYGLRAPFGLVVDLDVVDGNLKRVKFTHEGVREFSWTIHGCGDEFLLELKPGEEKEFKL